MNSHLTRTLYKEARDRVTMEDVVSILPSSNIRDSEIAWNDDMLDAMKFVKFDIQKNQSQMLKNLLDAFMVLKKDPGPEFVTVMCASIAGMPNVFDELEEPFFSTPSLPANQIQDLTSDVEMLQHEYKAVDNKLKFDCKDPKNADNSITIEHDETVFYNYLSTNEQMIKPILGIISLCLLRIVCREAENTMNHVNGRLYTQWGQLFNCQMPPKGLYFTKDQLKKLKISVNNDIDIIRRIIGMLIKRFDTLVQLDTSRANKCKSGYDYLVNIPISYYGFHLQRTFDNVKKKTNWDVLQVESLVETAKVSILERQMSNYIKVYTYIAAGLKGNWVAPWNNMTIRTRFYPYSRVMDRRCFASLCPHKNKELVCFLIGLAGEEENCRQFLMCALRDFPSKSLYYEQGKKIFSAKTIGTSLVPKNTSSRLSLIQNQISKVTAMYQPED